MFEGVAQQLRTRYCVSDMAMWGVVLGGIYALTSDPALIGGLLLGAVVVELTRLIREHPSVDGRRADLVVGLCLTLASLGWLSYEATTAGATGMFWLPALAVVAGLWLTLDARRDIVENVDPEPPADDLSREEVFVRLGHAQLLASALRDGPKTVPELAAGCDLTESRVREALDHMESEGVVSRLDGSDPADDGTPARYVLEESQLGASAFVRANGKRLFRRLLRPLRG